MINEVKPSREYVSLKSLEAFEKVADGKATKIIVPSDIQNTAGLLASLTETVKDQPKAE